MLFRISRKFERRVQSLWFPTDFLHLRPLIALILIFASIVLMGAIVNHIMMAIAVLLILSYVTLALIIIRALPDLLNLFCQKLWFSILVGEVLFVAVTVPANAAIFDSAENYTTGIFGPYIDASMIKLVFGFLRISIFMVGAGFVLLALEKARHGENWQPFAWNAFAVLMVVVLVEGMSTLFLSSSTTATPTPSVSPTAR